MRNAFRAVCAAILLSLAFDTLAEATDELSGDVTIQFENDVFAGTDQHYTHATRLEYTYRDNATPSFLAPLGHLFDLDSSLGYAFHLFLMQYLYTPTDISLEVPPPDDRPYAGWLAAGLKVAQNIDNHEDTSPRYVERGDEWSLSLGIIGPDAQSKRSQREVHELVNSGLPQGWDYQIENQPAADLSYQYNWKLGWDHRPNEGWDTELVPYAGGNLGNVFIQGKVGVKWRAGLQHSGLIRPRRDVPGSEL